MATVFSHNLRNPPTLKFGVFGASKIWVFRGFSYVKKPVNPKFWGFLRRPINERFFSFRHLAKLITSLTSWHIRRGSGVVSVIKNNVKSREKF